MVPFSVLLFSSVRYLGLYPNGDTPDSKGWVSLYLFYDGCGVGIIVSPKP
jgi:hypothetical protein